MKTLSGFALILCWSTCLLLLSSCSETINALPGAPFVYDDFGSEQTAAPLLGPKGGVTQVIVRFGSTNVTGPDVRYVNAEQAMRYLHRAARKLPATPEGAAEYQRLSKTYERIYYQYSVKRDAFMSAPSASYGRGGMNRAQMMPPMAPSI